MISNVISWTISSSLIKGIRARESVPVTTQRSASCAEAPVVDDRYTSFVVFLVRKNFCGDALTMPRVKDQEVISFNVGRIVLAREEDGKSAEK